MDTPRIYVASLSDYNAGRLHGRWIDATQGVDGIWEDVQAMLAESKEPNAEEWAIHDFSGFGAWKPSESVSFEDVSRVADLIEEHGQIISHLIDGHCEIDNAEDYLQDNYQGEFKNLEDWAYQHIEDTGMLQDVPETIKNYFNYESFAEDCRLNGDIFTIETGYQEVHIFWNQ